MTRLMMLMLMLLMLMRSMMMLTAPSHLMHHEFMTQEAPATTTLAAKCGSRNQRLTQKLVRQLRPCTSSTLSRILR